MNLGQKFNANVIKYKAWKENFLKTNVSFSYEIFAKKIDHRYVLVKVFSSILSFSDNEYSEPIMNPFPNPLWNEMHCLTNSMKIGAKNCNANSLQASFLYWITDYIVFLWSCSCSIAVDHLKLKFAMFVITQPFSFSGIFKKEGILKGYLLHHFEYFI